MIAPRTLLTAGSLMLIALAGFFAARPARAQAPVAFSTPDLNERKERMVQAGVPPETAEKVMELTKEVHKLQATPKPGSYRPEDLSPATRDQLKPLLDRGVPMERAVQMLLLQERYQNTLKELSKLPSVSLPPIGGEVEVETAPQGAPEAAPLNARLLNTAPGLGADSFAILGDETDKTERIYRVGDKFQNRTLVSVGWDAVRFRNGPQEEFLGMFGSAKIMEPPASIPSGSAPGPLRRYTPGAGGIQQKSDAEFVIDRAEVDKAMENLNQLFTQIRAVPHFQDGKAAGFRLFAIRPDSVFERIGLKNSDIVSKINGQELTDPALAMSLIQELRGAGRVSVELVRNRQPTTLRYEIR